MGVTWESGHPAIAAAVAVADPGQRLRVRGVVIREPAAVVLLADDRSRTAVILTLVAGVWTAPTMLGGGASWDPADRPARTRAPWAVEQPARSQSASPGPDGAPPAEAWTALSGLAAADALTVLVRSPLDEHEVAVPEDGVVLALLRAPWGSRPEITVRTRDGDVRHTAP